ncbi:MAG TPA: thioredoxin domain-containing protein [Candidatus Limnocylindrales bacterium]|nr:thioredoxin domain-containing protein [Candidatus Limnocylindrales bacterium]
MLVIVGVVVVLAVLAVTAVILGNQPSDAPIPPESVARYDDVLQTRTTEGYPRLGDASSPVQVQLFSSFDCTACLTLHDEIIDDLVQRVRDGRIALTFVPLYGTGSITNGQGAARAALCVSVQDGFWPYHDALFAWQGAFGNQAFTQSRLVTGVDALGLDRGAFELCSRSGAPDSVLTEARTDASALLNFIGTPTITINGIVPYDADTNQPLSGATALLEAVDRAIETIENRVNRPTPTPAQAPTTAPAAEATAEVTAEATPSVPTQAPTAEATAEATAVGG